MRVAASIVPSAVPEILGEDRERALRDGVPAPGPIPGVEGAAARRAADRGDGRAGRRRARPNPRRHRRPARPRRAVFDRRNFLRDSSRSLSRHRGPRASPICAERLLALVTATAGTRRVLVHGDFSPKNILVGPQGPVILDAECAWYGDPAFDLAFVLNHLLLKGAWRPQWRPALRGDVRRAARRLSRARRVGAVAGARRAHGSAAAGIAAGPHRRQVAGRVPDR